jgi:glutamate-ammonia-ligase adenylyltransferase
MNTLRKFKNRELLRIGLRDLMRESDTIETIEDLSNTADTCLQKAYEYCNEELAKKYGAPFFENMDGSKKPCEFVILGMGKLGGRELNFSSDIDLLYIYSSDKGMTSGIDLHSGNIENQITTHEYFVHLSRMITKMITEITDEGQVFRIDLDLRPEGKSGDITNSLRSAEIYYESWGQAWERQALLKCRHAAGSMQLGKNFLETIRPFIFRKYLDFSALREIKEMKEKINRSLKIKKNGKHNVKLGYGGIREIEFIIQSFQLIYGGREKWLRDKNSMRTLHRISEKGFLSYSEYFSLSNAYLFLRDIENRIQLISGRQTHDIPEDSEELITLARKMGINKNFQFPISNFQLMDAYNYHTENVRKIYDNLFSTDIYDITEMREDVSQWQIDIDDPVSSIAVLKEIGFKSPEMTRRNLILMRDGGAYAHPTIRSKRYFNRTLPSLLKKCAELPDADLAINNFEKFIDAGRVREMIYSVLSGSEGAVKSLSSIFGISQYLSNVLIQQPELVDAILITENIYQGKTREMLRDELARVLKSTDTYENSLDELCRFKRGEELRIGLRDILGIAGLQEIMSELSNLADVYIEFSLKLVEDDLVKRYGVPVNEREERSGFAIIAMGKLGGRELSFGSDLDIVFAYSDEGETRGAEGARGKGQGAGEKISSHFFFSKLCEKLIYALSGMTRFGFAYRVDTRLRPDGEKGVLVMTLKGYENYYQKRGEVWERQALTKARFIAGDERLGMELTNIIHKFVYDTPFEPAAAKEIDRMRKRMEQERTKSADAGRDIKLGRGGIADIEFIIQFLQLKYGGNFKEIRGTGSLDTMKFLRKKRLISEMDYQTLSMSYLFLRKIESRIRIGHDRPVSLIPDSRDELSSLAKKLSYKDNGESAGDKLYKDFESCAEKVREVYNRIIQNAEKEKD